VLVFDDKEGAKCRRRIPIDRVSAPSSMSNSSIYSSLAF